MTQSGIYKITNIQNGHFYIGQSKHIKKRWIKHRCPSNQHGKVMKRAIEKYGWDNFVFEVVEYCPIEDLNQKERYYISTLNPTYNMNEGGLGNSGHIYPQDAKQKLSAIAKKQWEQKTEAEKLHIINNNLKGPQKGHAVSKDSRDQISTKLKAYYATNSTSELQRQRASEANKGRVFYGKDHPKPVAMIDPVTGKILRTFNMVKDAARYVGNRLPSAISGVCRGRKKTAFGYRWAYLSECSVETIPQGSRVEEVGTTRSAEQPVQTLAGDIVQSVAIVKLRVADRGMLELVMRSGLIDSVYAYPVYRSDKFKYALGASPDLQHVPNLDAEPEDKDIIAFYAVAHIKGCVIPRIEVMSRKQVDAIKNRAQAKSGPWITDFAEMGRKTVLKRLCKTLPLSVESQRMLAVDDTTRTSLDADVDNTESVFDVMAADVASQPAPPAPEVVDTTTGEVTEDAALFT